jgi:hypothetical protein
VLSTSFSLPVVPWTEYFGYKVTFFRLLNFEASHWLKCKVFTASCLSIKRALVLTKLIFVIFLISLNIFI